MADAVVSLALDKVATLLAVEVSFLSGVREDVERLQADLNRIQSFLKDVDREKDQSERVRNWVAEIRELAYDADDVIDGFLPNIRRREVELCGFRPSMLLKAPQLHEIGTQIKSIRTRIGDLATSVLAYGYIKFGEVEGSDTSASQMQRRLRRTDPDDENEDIISLETTTMAVIEQLMNEEDQLRVVSIVGMGGLGKTTLAKKVYNRFEVKKHFDCYSWAFISQEVSPRDVLSGILLEISPSENMQHLGSITEELLVKRLKHALKERRYLVVLDDIWKEEAWDSLKQAFPKGKKGSKVLFTTRIREVALYADPRSSPVEPPFFTDEQGWGLLRKKAFLENSDETTKSYMSEFERLGKEMVRRCGGLPLAIAVLGGLLASKSVEEWEAVQADINAQFVKLQQRSQYAGVNWVLALSYHDLPWRLKPCFLYLSQFPEDWEIQIKELIQMWVAEGFIPQGKGERGEETMEDVGEGYIEELVSRSMVQVSRKEYTGIGVKTCRMHDLMRDMCLMKAKEEKFLGFIEYQQDGIILPSKRRIALHSQHIDDSSMVHLKDCSPQLRSLLYSYSGDSPFKFSMSKHAILFMLKNFKLLRVVKLCNIYMKSGNIPKEIGNLIHLRYLGLRWIGLHVTSMFMCILRYPLPASIGKLKNLYTLDVRGNSVIIPDILWKLKCLRHLFLDGTHRELRLDNLRNLQTLKRVQGNDLIRNDALLELRNLRDLAIDFGSTEEVEVILKSPIFESGHLRSLKMFGDSFPNLDILEHCLLLTKLELKGAIREDPKSLLQSLKFLPVKLTKLVLGHSALKQDPMGVLEKLPNLRFLKLLAAYQGSKIVCSAYGFRRLEILSLEWLPGIEEWEIQQGAMPYLNTLRLQGLSKLKMIPEGLMFVTTLRDFTVIDLNEEWKRRVKIIDGVEGEDFYKVRHIPTITIGPPY